MTNGGFLDQSKRTNKTGLTIVIAGHAAALTALALAPPEVITRTLYDPIVVGSYDEPKEPPPPPPEPVARTEQRSEPTTAKPIVSTGGEAVLTFDPRPIPQVDPQPLPLPVQADPVFVTATIDPAAMARFQPDYPPELIRADIEGTATVRVLIGADGRVKAVEMVNAAHPGFFDATKRQALRYWKFKAATRDGIAVESWRTMTVRFKIQS